MTRKEAIREYKERKTPRGIFSVRCTPNGRVWVGSSRNLDASKNSYWFGLRMGGHLDRSLQAEWTAQGEEAFTYEVLETFDDDVHPMELNDLLKRKQAEWVLKLDAGKLL
jgi:hypothetical protein